MLRNKTWIEAVLDESIDSMEIEEIKELIGYIEPTVKRSLFRNRREWRVTCAPEGGYFSTKKQTDAIVVAGIEQITALLLRKRK